MLDGCRSGNVFVAATGCVVYRGAKVSIDLGAVSIDVEPFRALSMLPGGLQVRHPLLDPQRFGRSTTKPGPPMKSLRLGSFY